MANAFERVDNRHDDYVSALDTDVDLAIDTNYRFGLDYKQRPAGNGNASTASRRSGSSPKAEDVLKQWLGANGDKSLKARSVYRYGRQVDAPAFRPDDITEFNIRIRDGKITGAATDQPGASDVEGEINAKTGAIKFTKKYGMWNWWAKLEYSGRFTPWGILGEWQASGPTSTLSNGRFIMWLDEDDKA